MDQRQLLKQFQSPGEKSPHPYRNNSQAVHSLRLITKQASKLVSVRETKNTDINALRYGQYANAIVQHGRNRSSVSPFPQGGAPPQVMSRMERIEKTIEDASKAV